MQLMSSLALMSTQSAAAPSVPAWLPPFLVVVPFTAVITGGFNLSEVLPAPVALIAGAGWGVALGLLVAWLRRYASLRAALEDVSVAAGVVAVAFAGCGGLAMLLLLNGALSAETLTGEALREMFLPAIPYYVVTNAMLELLIMPMMLYLGWRAGRRKIVIVVAAAIYFVMRVWTYLVFVPQRLGWAEGAGATEVLTTGERRQAAVDLMLDDPRWIVLLVILALLLIAMHLPASKTSNWDSSEPARDTVG
jgi:hypothetical protein